MFHKQKGNALVILIIIFAFLLGAGAVYFYFNKAKINPTPTPTQTPVPTATPESLNINEIEGPSNIIYLLEGDSFKKLVNLPYSPSNHFGNIRPILIQTKLFVADNKQIFEVDLKNKTKKSLYVNDSKDKEIVNLTTDGNHLFITVSPLETNYGEPLSLELLQIDLNSGKSTLIVSQKPVIYGSLSYLGKAQKADVIGSFGGDGCGGFGEIYTVLNSNSKKILETGGGCNTKPLFLGFIEEKLLMVSSPPDSYNFESSFQNYNEIYYFNPLTEKSETIFDLKSIGKIGEFLLSEDKKKLALSMEKQIWILNLESKKIEKKIEWTEEQTYAVKFVLNKIYFQHETQFEGKITDTIAELDIDTNAQKSYQLSYQREGYLYSGGLIGIVDKKPLVHIYSFPMPNP